MSLTDVSARRVAGILVLLLVVAPFAAYTAPALVGADESYIVLTGSMEPAISPGDVVFVSAAPASTIGVGDVITFDRGAAVPTTHRVIEVVTVDGERAFRTMGDANEDPDSGLVSPAQVVGVVTLSVPYIGTVITAADSQYGFVAMVVIPFGLLVLDVVYSAVRKRRDPPAAADGTAAAEGTGDGDVPAVYDPVVAAEAYYAAAADRLAAAEVTATRNSVSERDMSASLLLAGGLVAYAGWNAYWQFDSFGAPRAETMSVLSGALVTLAFLGYLRFAGGSTDGADDTPTPAPAPTAEPAAPAPTAAAATAPTAAPAVEPVAPFVAPVPSMIRRDEEVRDAE